jgi:hypothetical protein
MAVINSSETLFSIYQTTQHHIPDDSNPHYMAYYSFQSQSNVTILANTATIQLLKLPQNAHSGASLPNKNDEISLVMEVQNPMASVRFFWFISAYSATNMTVG